jgi:bacterioferritin-associated ferredoxin
MDLQSILVSILFLLAVFALGRMIYRSLSSKKGCASNCGKCAADFSEFKILEEKAN